MLCVVGAVEPTRQAFLCFLGDGLVIPECSMTKNFLDVVIFDCTTVN